MKSNNFIIAVLVAIIVVLAFLIVYPFFAPNNETVDTANASAPEDNQTVNVTHDVANATLTDDSPKQYDDWQEDYETGEYDEYGSPIYRSVVSTSGGQNEPGIYEAYWSENGPISEERIG